MQPVMRMSGTQGIARILTPSDKSAAFFEKAAELPRKGGESDSAPQWTAGLRQLYNSVVEEPLPLNFTELLAKLDQIP